MENGNVVAGEVMVAPSTYIMDPNAPSSYANTTHSRNILNSIKTATRNGMVNVNFRLKMSRSLLKNNMSRIVKDEVRDPSARAAFSRFKKYTDRYGPLQNTFDESLAD